MVLVCYAYSCQRPNSLVRESILGGPQARSPRSGRLGCINPPQNLPPQVRMDALQYGDKVLSLDARGTRNFRCV